MAFRFYEPHGRRVFRTHRAGSPRWFFLSDARLEMLRLTSELVSCDDPGEVLPMVNELAWAIHDARSASAEDANPATQQIERAA